MKKLWSFGGTNTEFGKDIRQGFDTIQFGRHNVDYSNVEAFISKVESHPTPDVISINMNPQTAFHDLTKNYTTRHDISILTELINTRFYFQVRLIEWFFLNNTNKRVLFITSQQPNMIFNDVLEEDNYLYHRDGNLLLYRMSRALEHQLIHQQNSIEKNYKDDNIIMGVCVGSNFKGTSSYINKLMLTDTYKRNVFGLCQHAGHVSYPILINDESFIT